ncbi:MAG: hypothetical protein CTY20_07895 [Hyphomicrobium sp.]|nr:MAG: hypothetical protein CTY20_07895 [Hyphomicrobium sp.]
MADTQWNPWYRERDANGYTKFHAKPAEHNPIVRELAMSSAFVARARAWSWSKQGATNKPQDLTRFAPWVDSNIEGVAEYWHAVMRMHRTHRPDLIPPDEMICSLAGQVALALDLSAGNPLLQFDEGEW